MVKNFLLSHTQEKLSYLFYFSPIVIPQQVALNFKYHNNPHCLLLLATDLSSNSLFIYVFVSYAVGPAQMVSLVETFSLILTSGYLWSNPSNLDRCRIEDGGGSWFSC
jgi:hypothetical protein